MSLITYVLVCALCSGTANQFNPEVISKVATMCVVTQVLEVFAIKAGFQLMQVPIPVLDLVSYTGYKYVGLSLSMLVSLLVSHVGQGYRSYLVTFIWVSSAMSYFMLKTMANTIPSVTAQSGPRREVMVFATAGAQIAIMWFLGQTKFL